MPLDPALIREIKFPDGRTVIWLGRDATGLGPIRRGAPIDPADLAGTVIHHTVYAVTDTDLDGVTLGDLDDIAANLAGLQRIRAADLGPEVPYSFVTYRHPDPMVGILGEGRGYRRSGAHTLHDLPGTPYENLNYTRLGVAIAGNTSSDPITPGVEAAILWAMAWLPAATIATTGHRDHHATECPGTTGYAALGRLQPANVTQLLEDFAAMTAPMKDQIADGTAPTWAAAGVAELIAAGITGGDTPGTGQPTRWETLTYITRLRRELLAGLDDAVRQITSGGLTPGLDGRLTALRADVDRNAALLEATPDDILTDIARRLTM